MVTHMCCSTLLMGIVCIEKVKMLFCSSMIYTGLFFSGSPIFCATPLTVDLRIETNYPENGVFNCMWEARESTLE
jgi:hypothetical protein